MDGKRSIRYLQEYIQSKDHQPEKKQEYFLKLTEEVGELANAMRKNCIRLPGQDIKGTIDEECWDVMYYAMALANCYGIDLEQTIRDKEAVSNQKYRTGAVLEENR